MVSVAPRILLLRGINVGGHRKLPMTELREMLTDVGFVGVRTYIQSGNVVVSGGPVDDDAAVASVAEAITQRFGFDVPIVVRRADELGPLLDRSAELFDVTDPSTHDKFVHVGFLAAPPTAAAIGALQPDRSPGDVVVVEGRHVHVRYAVGASSTKITGDYLERTLRVSMTMRNLATIRTLRAMAAEPGSS